MRPNRKLMEEYSGLTNLISGIEKRLGSTKLLIFGLALVPDSIFWHHLMEPPVECTPDQIRAYSLDQTTKALPIKDHLQVAFKFFKFSGSVFFSYGVSRRHPACW